MESFRGQREIITSGVQVPGFRCQVRVKAKGKRQRAKGKRQKAKGKRQKAKGKRQKAEGRRQKAR
jgi:hypothetical protein